MHLNWFRSNMHFGKVPWLSDLSVGRISNEKYPRQREDKEIQVVFFLHAELKKTKQQTNKPKTHYCIILLEIQNDANQHILLTSSIANSSSLCEVFCPLYLSQWWSVCPCRCREVCWGISHTASWLCITLDLALLPSGIP